MRPAYLFLINILYFAIIGLLYITFYDKVLEAIGDAAINGMPMGVVDGMENYWIYGFPLISVLSMGVYDFVNSNRPSESD